MRTIATLCLLGLGACAAPPAETPGPTHAAAMAVTEKIIRQNFPGTNVETVSTCVVDGATVSEFATIAAADGAQIGEETLAAVSAVLGRADTLNCIARDGTHLVVQRREVAGLGPISPRF